MSTPSIRVLVVDDHPVTRAGLVALVREDASLEVVAECARAADVVPAAARTRPDVALIDLRLPDRDGWAVIAEVTRAMPKVRIVAVSALDGDDAKRRALEAGAHAFLHKGVAATEIVRTIHKVLATEQLRETRKFLATPPASEPLTPREQDVLRLLVEGLTNQGIADGLGIGVGTVRTHVARILDKLDVAHRTEAAVVAVRRGLI